jgi:hypothetical protein
MRFHLFCFSILAPFFSMILLFARERFHSLEFSRRITSSIGSKLGQGMIMVLYGVCRMVGG